MTKLASMVRQRAVLEPENIALVVESADQPTKVMSVSQFVDELEKTIVI